MGLITNLIRDHNQKQEADLNKNLSMWKTIASMPNASDELKGIAFQNIGNLAGGALELPKKAHGVLGQVLAGFSSLNPNPKDQNKGKMQAVPQAGPGAEGKSDAQGQLPGAPAYSPFMTDAQVSSRDDKLAANTKRSLFNEQQSELDTKQARLDKLFDDKSDPNYKMLSAELQSGIKGRLPSAAATKAKATRIQVGGKWTDALVHPDGSYTTLDGEDIDASKITNADAKAEPHTAAGRPSYNQQELHEIADNKFPDATKAQKDAWVANVLYAQKSNALKNTSVGISGKEQTIGINAADSGIGGGRGGSGMPPAPGGSNPSASMPLPARPSGKAGLPGGPAAPADGAKPSKEVVGKAAADTGGAGAPVSAVRMQYLQQHDQDIAAFMNSLTGLPTNRGKGQNIRRQKGESKLLSLIPGSSIESLRAEQTGRQDVQKALTRSTGQLEAYGLISAQIDNLGKQLLEARQKIPESSPKWQQVKQYIAHNYTGDPDTAALVTAANEFQRIYGRFSAGAGQSTAQTNVSAQSKTDEVVNSLMKGATIQAVIGQVQKGAANDLNGVRTTIRAGRKELEQPWGQFDATRAVPEPTQPNEGAPAQASSQNREQKNSAGAYRHTTDGGSTWQPGRLPK